MKDKITQLPGTKPGLSLKDSVALMIEQLPASIDFYKTKAKIQREYFLALKKEGFSHSEALELTKGML